ncbi:hypothetical protein HMPREF9608_01071, partial [Cutibacterium acnes HL067PA1]
MFLAQHLLVGLLWCAASSRVQEFGIRFGGTVRWFSALTAYLRGPAFAIMPTPGGVTSSPRSNCVNASTRLVP